MIAVGRMKAGPERDLLRRYLDRADAMGRSLGFGSVQVVEVEESRARTANARRHEEAEAIRTRVPEGAEVIPLDERGDDSGSVVFAQRLGRFRDAGRTATVLLIGGPDGLAPEIRAAHRSICYGRATFPHQFVRVMLAEQIYRAFTILAGHPYHRSD